MMTLAPFQLTPDFRERVWGGQRLRPGAPPIGEAWVVYEHNRVATGPCAGRTLGEVAAHAPSGEALLGRRAGRQWGARFPLLIKLLDCADWLSVQVHPDDAQAVRLEGPGHFGKTEAWHILEADPGAQIISGVRPGATAEMLAEAIRHGTLPELAQYAAARAGDTILVPAGTIHALGPGLFLYEVQQASDITYRVFDWNRPASDGRQLHIEKSLAVANPAATGQPVPLPALDDTGRARLVSCEYFTLELIGGEAPVALDTAGESFHALTVIDGAAVVESGGGALALGRLDTAVVPAATGAYRVRPDGKFRALVSSVT
jgi:mannose-6-phosphate isomerase